MTRKFLAGLVMLSTLTMQRSNAVAQQVTVSSPPMGWNSWDAYGLTITEQQFRDNVTAMKAKLAPFGWKYAVIDEGWFFENPQDRPHPEKLVYEIDSFGRYIPVPSRFPSSPVKRDGPVIRYTPAPKPNWLPAKIDDTGFKPLADYVHGQGLLFGIHIVRGIPRASVERNTPIADTDFFRAQDAADTTDACPWDPTNWGVKDNAAGQAWYDSLLKQYAEWGVDLLKVDCISDHPYKANEIRMIRKAIDKAGRPMVLSLSPGPTQHEHASEVAELANMWRISDDVWDVWSPQPGKDFPQSVRGQFARAPWWGHAMAGRVGRYPDLDMLPLDELRPSPGWGEPRHSRLTLEEEKTLLTFWSCMQSPLILGANLTMLDEPTLKLLTNRELLRIDQHGMFGAMLEPEMSYDELLAHPPTGVVGITGNVRMNEKDGDVHGWYAYFNLGDEQVTLDRTVAQMLGTPAGVKPKVTSLKLTDVWSGKSLGTVTKIHYVLPPHGAVLLEDR